MGGSVEEFVVTDHRLRTRATTKLPHERRAATTFSIRAHLYG